MESNTNGTHIARNTLVLYIRMLVSMFFGLFTSRVILQTLGVVDYGIYSIVGSVVSMFSFINSTLSGASSRFLAFSLGKNVETEMKDTFSSVFLIHAAIAILFLFLSESIGLWFLNNKIIIPEGREYAAQIVFQFSIMSAVLGFLQVPFNASIIAHEKMTVFAYIEILNSLLRLCVAYLLIVAESIDRLILYAALIFGVVLVITIFYSGYCFLKFQESKLTLSLNQSIIKPILQFSGWNLFGTMALSGRIQATAYLINIFHGVIYNAAAGIASTVFSAVNGLASNVSTAFRPTIIKAYAAENYEKCTHLINTGAKYAGFLMIAIVIPLIVELHFVMHIWLTEVPAKAVLFCSIMLVDGCISIIGYPIHIGITATGKMFLSSFLGGFFEIAFIFVLYLLFTINCSVEYAYYLSLIHNFILLALRNYILKKQFAQFSIRQYCIQSFIPVLICFFVVFVFLKYAQSFFEEGFVRIFIMFSMSVVLVALFLLLISSTAERRSFLRKLSVLHNSPD